MQKLKVQSKIQNLFLKLYPISIILGVWLVFSYPYFLQHRIPFPATFATNFFSPWSAYHLYDGPVKNNAMPDVITQMYPWRYFTIQSLKIGQIPLWNPYSFSGTPHLANYQSAVLSPFNILFFLFSFVDAWSLLILLQPLLAGLFTYIYCRSLSISKVGSVVASIGFMFCGFITTWMDYGTLGYAILFLPLALFALEKFFQTKNIRYWCLLAFSIPLSFLSGHFQISLYFLLFVLAYIAWKGFQTKNRLVSIYVLLGAFFGLLVSMPQILPSLELYTQSLRSGLFQQVDAIPLGYFPAFLAPDFFGNPVTRNAWFGHYAEWNGYIGLVPFMLGIYAIIRKRNRFTIFLFCFSIIVLFLAFATPILNLLIALRIPVLSTSASSRIIVLFSFIFVVLAGFGFDVLLKDVKERRIKPLVIWLSGFFIIFLCLWAIVALKVFLPVDKIAIAKQNLKLPTIIFCISAGVVLLDFILRLDHWGKMKRYETVYKTVSALLLTSCFVLLISFDLLRFSTKWQPFDAKDFMFSATNITQNFPKKENYQRIYGGEGAQLSVYYHYPSVEGYDPLSNQRYGEFIASANGKLEEPKRSVVTLPNNAAYTSKELTLLDVGYILERNSDHGQTWSFPFSQYPPGQFTAIYNDNYYRVYKNNIPLKHAFFAQNYKIQTNPQDILTTLFQSTTHLMNTLVLEEDPHIPQGGVTGNATVTQYSSNEITITARTNKDALLFLSEVFYPGWKAYVDGQETKIYRADYTFRSIIVPSGMHTVVFRYEPLSFTLGCWLCLLGLLGIIAFPFISKRNLLQ